MLTILSGTFRIFRQLITNDTMKLRRKDLVQVVLSYRFIECGVIEPLLVYVCQEYPERKRLARTVTLNGGSVE